MNITKPQRELSRGDTGGQFNFDQYLTHPASVQVMYRPALHETTPAVPQPDDTTSEAALWWRREWMRSTEGWTAPDGTWINPIYYWYLNHVKIEMVDEATGREWTEAPLYCDADHDTFNEIYSCLIRNIKHGVFRKGALADNKRARKKNKQLLSQEAKVIEQELRSLTVYAKDLIATKGRRKHWSYDNLNGVFLWAFTVDANGHLGVGFDCKDSREEGQRVFKGAYDRLHPFWKHAELYTDKEGELSACEWKVSEEGDIQKTEGYVIHFKEMDKRPGAFRGRRYRIILLDEAGKYMHLGKIIGSIRDCLRTGTLKFGTLLIGGTCDPITNKSDAYQKLWERARIMGWRRYFIPAWKLAPPNVNWFTGVSDEEKARAAYMKERQEFLDAGDMEGFHLTVQENPLDEHELFMLPTLSSYPSHKLLEATIAIAAQGDKLPVMRGRLEWKTNSYGKTIGEVYFQEDVNGPWLCHRDYQPHKEVANLDVLGIDSVYKDSAPHSDSKCAAVLYRRFNHRIDHSDMPALVYFDRPLLDIFADEIKKVMVWTGCRVILEHNDKWLADQLLKEKVANVLGVKMLADQLMFYNDEPGLRNNEQTILAQTMLALKWINEGGLGRTWFQSIIDSLKNWRQKNDDIASAFHLCMMGVDTLRESVMDENDARREVPDFRFMQNDLLTITPSGNRFATIQAAVGWEGVGLAPIGMGNAAWGNPLRTRQGAAQGVGFAGWETGLLNQGVVALADTA
jgi:hypothetical protein